MPMSFDLKKLDFKKTEEFFRKHLQLIIVVLIVFLGFYFLQQKPQKIAVFDFKSTYATFLKETEASRISKEKQSILVKNFPIAVNDAVNNYVAKHHAVVLVNAAVVGGAVDATPEIQELIAKEMHKLSHSKTNG